MTPIHFPEANKKFVAPPDLTQSQCGTVPGYTGVIHGGSLDGEAQAVVAWWPSPEEIELIRQGKPIFLSVIGGLTPHFLSMSFQEATHPA